MKFHNIDLLLTLSIEDGFIMYNNKDGKHYPSGYLCPITFDFFVDPYDEELSEEHVPQKSIGGKVICLTQKQWNVNSGLIDNHVAERAKELIYNKETGKSRALAYIDSKLKSELTIDLGNDKPKFSFKGGGFKESNPGFIDLINKQKNEEKFKVTIMPKGTLTRKTRLGYLKNAYLIAFSTFGYSLIFGAMGSIALFRTIRHQLRNPVANILGELPFVYEVKDESKLEGIYLTKIKGNVTLSVFFRLSEGSINRVGVTFPPLNLNENEVGKWSVYCEDAEYFRLENNTDFISFDEFSRKQGSKYNNIEYTN